mgnify:CR=1 FL=1
MPAYARDLDQVLCQGEVGCRGCADEHLDDTLCCVLVPTLPLRLPRRLRRDPVRLALAEFCLDHPFSDPQRWA